jgi:hypothetical protein
MICGKREVFFSDHYDFQIVARPCDLSIVGVGSSIPQETSDQYVISVHLNVPQGIVGSINSELDLNTRNSQSQKTKCSSNKSKG